jgi:hypothetical protein
MYQHQVVVMHVAVCTEAATEACFNMWMVFAQLVSHLASQCPVGMMDVMND